MYSVSSSKEYRVTDRNLMMCMLSSRMKFSRNSITQLSKNEYETNTISKNISICKIYK